MLISKLNMQQDEADYSFILLRQEVIIPNSIDCIFPGTAVISFIESSFISGRTILVMKRWNILFQGFIYGSWITEKVLRMALGHKKITSCGFFLCCETR